MNMNMEKPILRHSGSCLAGNDRGSALLMTLGVLLLMMVIGLGFIFSAIVDRDVASAQAEANKAKLTAESAGARGMAIIQKQLDFTTLAADPKFEFSPLMTNLFPTAANKTNGSYRLPSSGYLDILKDSSLPASATNPKIGDMAVTVMNRTGKLDPNWFGRPAKDFIALGGDTWNLGNLASMYSNGNSPVMTGFLYDLNCSTLLSSTVRNDLFVASLELRKAILSPASSPPWSVFASLPKDYQTWGSCDQIFLKAGTAWSSQLADYSPGGVKSNLDFLFPRSPVPLITTNSSGPDGCNTFIDWGGIDDTSKINQWRNSTLLPPVYPPAAVGNPEIRQRFPVEGFAYLNLSAAATATGADIQIAGTGNSYFDGQYLSSRLPWFRMQYDQRIGDNTDPSSYYELVANFKDYVSSGTAPTTNVWPVSASAFSTAAISNPDTSVPYPFCGTKPVPNIAEIKLDYNATNGLSTASGIELVNLYGSTLAPNDLAAVIEAEWTDDSSGTAVLKNPQVAVVGFGTAATPLPSLAISTGFRSLTANVATTKAKTTRVRVYLIYCPGVGGSIGSVTAATLRAGTLLDTAILDIDAGDQFESAYGSGSGSAPAVGASLVGCKLTVPVPALNRTSNTRINKGTLCTYGGVMYVVIQRHKPKNVNGAVGSANWLANYRALIPQPSPLTAAGTFTCTMRGPGTSIAPGGLFGYNYNAVTKKVTVYVLANDVNVSTAANRPPAAGNNNFYPVGEYTVASGSYTLRPVYLEARDPRNNTCWTNQGNRLWSSGAEGSFGQINPDWWNRIPDLSTLTGQALLVGDLVWSGGFEYAVKTAHAAGAQVVTNTTYFTAQTGLSGRDVWNDDDGDTSTVRTVNVTEDDVLVKPRDGIASSSAPATVDSYIRPSTAYVRCGSPQSLWELGAINRAEPWRTVRLSGGQLYPTPLAVQPVNLGDYAMGDWMLLDEVSLYQNIPAGDAPNFTTGYKTENGKANPNADVAGTPGMKQLFMGLGRGANADLANPRTAYESQPAISLLDLSVVIPATFAGVFTSAPIVSRGELATNAYLPTLWNRNTLTTDAAGRTYIGLDRSQEEMIGKVANLLQTRYQYFEIQAIGRSYKGTETQQLTGTHIIRSVVERDAFTGKARTISTEHIDQ